MSARLVASSRMNALWLYAAAAGAIVLAFPPLGAWPLALVASWPATSFVLAAPTPRAAAFRGWLYGVAVLGLGTLWLAETQWLNLVLVALIGAGWHALWGWAVRRVLPATQAPLAAPLLWTAMEMCRLNWPSSGYPWVFLGHALAASPVLVQAADLGGVLLLSFLAATVGDAFRLLRAGQRRPAVVAGLLLGAAAIYGVVRPSTLPEPREGPLVATIQPGFPQELKERSQTARERYERCMEQSRELLAAEPPPDVLVWGETMWPWLIGEGRTADSEKAWAPLVVSRRVQLVIGVLWWRMHEGQERLSNSALLIDPSGHVTGRYDKEFLVPGGEAVPFGRLMPAGFKAMVEGWIAASAGFVVDLLPGSSHAPFLVGGEPCGVTICFENAYGRPSRESVGAGASFLLNLSNEAWFASSAEHDHMELQSVLRAVETRRALFRSTNSGISCLVRPDGRKPAGKDRLVVGGADRAVAGTLATRIPLYDGLTPYVRWGEWIGWVSLLASGLFLLLFRPKRLP